MKLRFYTGPNPATRPMSMPQIGDEGQTAAAAAAVALSQLHAPIVPTDAKPATLAAPPGQLMKGSEEQVSSMLSACVYSFACHDCLYAVWAYSHIQLQLQPHVARSVRAFNSH